MIIQMLMGEISPVSLEYIRPEVEDQFEDDLMNLCPSRYCQYMNSLIHHYVAAVYQYKITSMETEWQIDDLGNVFLINVRSLMHQSVVKF